MSTNDEPNNKQDMVFVHSPSEHGDGYRVIRKRDDAIELGEIRSVQEGKPIHGELVKLTPRNEHERLFNVEVVVPKEAAQEAPTKAGPAQVASDAYRRNWDAIFGEQPKSNLLN